MSLTFYANIDLPTSQIKYNLASLGGGYRYPIQLTSVDLGVQIGLHLPIIEFGKNNDHDVRNSIIGS